MEYVVGNREHYVKEKDGEKIFGGGGHYVVFFSPNEHGGNYIYTNQLDGATKFKTLEEAQSVANHGGLDVWEYMVDENGCTHLSKALGGLYHGSVKEREMDRYVLATPGASYFFKDFLVSKEVVLTDNPKEAHLFHSEEEVKKFNKKWSLNLVEHELFPELVQQEDEILRPGSRYYNDRYVLGILSGDYLVKNNVIEQEEVILTDYFSSSFTFLKPREVLKAAQKTGLAIYRVYFDELEE